MPIMDTPAGMPFGSGPLPPPVPIRPSVLWIVLAWALFLALTVVAFVAAIVTIGSAWSGAVPTQRITGGEIITVHLDPADEPAIYAGFDMSPGFSVATEYPYTFPVDAGCALVGPSMEEVPLVDPERNLVIRIDGTEWHEIALPRVPEPGAYQLLCDGEADVFGVGREPSGWFDRVTALLALVLAAGAGAVGATVVVVRKRTEARRRAHRL